MADVTMPRLSDTMEEGTIASWLKKPGEEVHRGDIIAQIETDKATMDLTAFESGTLQEILVPEGQTVAIGQPVARIGSGSGDGAASAPPAPAPSQGQAPRTDEVEPPAAAETGSEAPASPEARENVGEAPEPTAPASEQPVMPASTERSSAPPGTDGRGTTDGAGASEDVSEADMEGKVRASPMARHIAAEHGLDLSSLQGSGPQGRVIRADVEAALASGAGQTPPAQPQAPAEARPAPGAPTPAPQATDGDERVQLSQMRRTIARRMAESTRTVPHFFLTTTIDAVELAALRKQVNDQIGQDGPRVSVNDLVVKAAALALRKVPEVNVSFAEDSLIKHQRVNIGIAVATERGLIVPVVRDADQKSVGTIARQARDLAERAQAGKLQPDDYSGGTFTVSNLGMFGVEQFNAVINPPEAGILAVGAIVREATDVGGEVGLRERMKVTLSVDHRALDGAVGARYLQALKALLEKPMLLLV